MQDHSRKVTGLSKMQTLIGFSQIKVTLQMKRIQSVFIPLF